MTSSWLLPTAGTGAPRTLTAAAAAAEPGSRRRRRKMSTSEDEVQQQQMQQQQQQVPVVDQAVSQQQQSHNTQPEQEQQQQQQHSRQLLWETAAQLGLKRGSQIALSERPAAAGQLDEASENKEDGGSSSAAADNSRKRSSWSNSSSISSRQDSPTLSWTADSSNSGSDWEADSISSVDDDVFAAVARLGRFLDFRERCATEVLNKLAALGYDRQLAQRVLVALQREGLQSDARFAEMFVRGYWRTKAHSPSRLAYELRSRRVAQQHIDAALASVFGPGRQLPDRAENASNEQEEEMWQQLVEMCRRRADLTRTEPQQKRRAKLASWLQRRGHTMSTIFRIFEALGI
uniref:Regulatory protein RecX n=1 Tax=Tetradesmus obliquus TaxID=3088 RepID=A0A383VNC9_TETOB|eukprot:jgi/Sobl393_1/12821/SZX66262.1